MFPSKIWKWNSWNPQTGSTFSPSFRWLPEILAHLCPGASMKVSNMPEGRMVNPRKDPSKLDSSTTWGGKMSSHATCYYSCYYYYYYYSSSSSSSWYCYCYCYYSCYYYSFCYCYCYCYCCCCCYTTRPTLRLLCHPVPLLLLFLPASPAAAFRHSKRLHREAFTHSRLSHTASIYTQQAFTQSKLLHTASIYTQQAFTHSKLLHTASIYTQQAFTPRSFYTQQVLTHRSFTHSKRLHREAFTHSRLSHTASLYTQQAFTHSKLLHTVRCQAKGSYTVPAAGSIHLVYGQPHRVHIKIPWGHHSLRPMKKEASGYGRRACRRQLNIVKHRMRYGGMVIQADSAKHQLRAQAMI